MNKGVSLLIYVVKGTAGGDVRRGSEKKIKIKGTWI